MLGNSLQCTAPPPTKNHLAPKTNSVEVKKLCLRRSITSERELLFPESSNESLGLAGPGWHNPEEVTVVSVLSCPHRQVWVQYPSGSMARDYVHPNPMDRGWRQGSSPKENQNVLARRRVMDAWQSQTRAAY